MGVLSDRYRRPAALSGGKATSKVYERCGSGGWPGPHLFLKTIFALDFARIDADNQISYAA
jgi:hypothetical protein